MNVVYIFDLPSLEDSTPCDEMIVTIRKNEISDDMTFSMTTSEVCHCD